MYRATLSLIALCVVLAFFLPQILSTPIGKPFFIHLVEKKLKAKVEIEKLHLTWFGPQRFQGVYFQDFEIEGNAEEVISDLPLWSLSELKGSFVLKQGHFLSNEVKVTEVHGELKNHFLDIRGKTGLKGAFSLRGKVFSKKNFEVTAQISDFPSVVLDALLKTENLLHSILGSTFNLQGKVTFTPTEKSTHIAISSPNLTTSLNATMTDAALLLNEPLKVMFHLNEPLSRTLMSHFNPLFLTGISSKKPVLLTLSDQGFKLPFPFSLKTFQIEKGSLDMGQIECQTGQSLRSLLSFFQRQSSSNRVNLWLTPLFFQLQNGKLNTGRMDGLLANSIHICTWGSINLIKDSLHMYLGIPADTLSQLFGIKNVQKNYVLKIPIRGSIKNPDLETGPATAKIATMAASQQIPKVNKFLNPLIQTFSHIEEKNDAPPAKRPFPWER